MITYPSHTLEPIDGWFQYEEFDQRFFDESLNQFAGTSNSGNEMADAYCGNANLMTDDLCMKQESMELDFNQILLEENFMQEQNQNSSSLSSKLTPSIDSSDNSSTRIFRSDSISSTSVSGSKTSILQPGSRSLTCSIPSSCDDAITKAMVAVISSVSSASSSSSPSIISHNYSPNFGQSAKSGAFIPFVKSDFSPKHEANFANDGQNLIKRSLAMLRSIKPAAEQEPKPSNLHHMISERRRREKLNASFDMLRMLLPPGSKKDKTSVLIKAASYLKTLESQISELQEKTLKLESYLPSATGSKDTTTGSTEKVQIQILRTSCSEPQVHQINLRINVVQECDVVELVLHILECLKLMEIVSLVSVDAYTFSPHMKLHAKASIKLRIKESKWNEALFRQAIEKAVDDVITTNTNYTYTKQSSSSSSTMCPKPKPSRLHKL